jgi:hypothetical protein
MAELKWLDGYSGQSAGQLVALASEYRVDSIVSAFRDRDGKLIEVLIDRCDGPYFDSCEPIADRLFAYVSANCGSIRLPHG